MCSTRRQWDASESEWQVVLQSACSGLNACALGTGRGGGPCAAAGVLRPSPVPLQHMHTPYLSLVDMRVNNSNRGLYGSSHSSICKAACMEAEP